MQGRALLSIREHWVLLSEGGTVTTPHMDATGFAKWIAVQEGEFVLAWVTRPTLREAEAWLPPRNAALLGSPHREWTPGAGKWRVAVLAPEDVVVMPSSMLHTVQRPDNSPALAFDRRVLFFGGVPGVDAHNSVVVRGKRGQVTNEDNIGE